MVRKRVVTTLDAMVLLGATAVGFALMREAWHAEMSRWFARPIRGWTVAGIIAHVPFGMLLFFPMLVCWSVAIFVLRFADPRPRLRRILLQPGAAACATATALVLARITEITATIAASTIIGWLEDPGAHVGTLLLEKMTYFEEFFDQARSSPIVGPGTPILCLWMFLYVSRMWRPESTWVDRAGLAVGTMWIVMSLCFWWSRLVLFYQGQPPWFGSANAIEGLS
jgi:hypothetical protein